MKRKAFDDVKQEFNPKMDLWSKRFAQADRMKRLAFEIAGYSTNPVIIAKMNKRMNFAWSKVEEVEPFETFKSGELTNKAAYYLNGIKLLKAFKLING